MSKFSGGGVIPSDGWLNYVLPTNKPTKQNKTKQNKDPNKNTALERTSTSVENSFIAVTAISWTLNGDCDIITIFWSVAKDEKVLWPNQPNNQFQYHCLSFPSLNHPEKRRRRKKKEEESMQTTSRKVFLSKQTR